VLRLWLQDPLPLWNAGFHPHVRRMVVGLPADYFDLDAFARGPSLQALLFSRASRRLYDGMALNPRSLHLGRYAFQGISTKAKEP
jgi:hypothetical protein